MKKIVIAILALILSTNTSASCRNILDSVITLESKKAFNADRDKFLVYVSKFYEKYGDIEEVNSKLINEVYSPEIKNILLEEFGLLLMHEAISMNHLNIVEKLLELGVEISKTSNFFPEPILIAALVSNQPALEIFKLKAPATTQSKIDSAIKYVKCMKDEQ